MHSTGTSQPVETQDVFFWRLAGRSAPTGLAIVHWIGSINAIKWWIIQLNHDLLDIYEKNISHMKINNKKPHAMHLYDTVILICDILISRYHSGSFPVLCT